MMDTGATGDAAGYTPVAALRVTRTVRESCAQWLRSAATGAHTGQHRILIVDRSACRRIDAADMELLLELHRTLRRGGGRPVIREPAAPVRRLLRIARVDQALTITPDGDGTDSRPPVLQHGEALT